MADILDMKGKPMSSAMLQGLSAVRGMNAEPDYAEEIELALLALQSASAHLSLAAQCAGNQQQVINALSHDMSVKVIAGNIRLTR